ncbi:hypothetical protein BT63DRAFT_423014 [Microthyrium microscopicum]|uniref:Uncharacterized protein n=1 Tax=Microthyrium microscopicum TaxID=703497 RepID=A0A6A6UHY5_9PEZI|nr:hypothetical protein BT63DRAFT_423014 [Microthyrium microscopicum]
MNHYDFNDQHYCNPLHHHSNIACPPPYQQPKVMRVEHKPSLALPASHHTSNRGFYSPASDDTFFTAPLVPAQDIVSRPSPAMGPRRGDGEIAHLPRGRSARRSAFPGRGIRLGKHVSERKRDDMPPAKIKMHIYLIKMELRWLKFQNKHPILRSQRRMDSRAGRIRRKMDRLFAMTK